MMIDDDGETISRGILTRYTRHPNRPPLPRGYTNARISFDEIPKVTRVQTRPSRRKINLEKWGKKFAQRNNKGGNYPAVFQIPYVNSGRLIRRNDV